MLRLLPYIWTLSPFQRNYNEPLYFDFILCLLVPADKIFPGGKGGRFVGLTTLPFSCTECMKIWEPDSLERSGAVQAGTVIVLPLALPINSRSIDSPITATWRCRWKTRSQYICIEFPKIMPVIPIQKYSYVRGAYYSSCYLNLVR
jgi:hypothetical protein